MAIGQSTSRPPPKRSSGTSPRRAASLSGTGLLFDVRQSRALLSFDYEAARSAFGGGRYEPHKRTVIGAGDELAHDHGVARAGTARNRIGAPVQCLVSHK